MDAISSSNFQPVQPDGYVLSSPGREAPKIEITETDPLCDSPLSHTGCDVGLSDWDDLHLHGDGTTAGDYLVEQQQPPSPQHQDPCDARGGARRGEGGPGKCPSPSRSSPRRHSPGPYSPKRQSHHRARHAGSCVASSDQSPAAFRPYERPCSLPLTSAAAEEFICVSYSEPFSSPTITHASEGILSISISCSQAAGVDHDVEMVPNDDEEDADAGNAVPSRGDDAKEQGLGSSCSSTCNRPAAVDDASCVNCGVCHGSVAAANESRARNGELHHVAQLGDAEPQSGNGSSTAFAVCGLRSGDGNFENSMSLSEAESMHGNPSLASVVDDDAEPRGGNPDSRLGPGEAESMEGEEFCPEEVCSSSDSSSSDEDDDDMEDVMLTSQPGIVSSLGSRVPFGDNSTHVTPGGPSSSSPQNHSAVPTNPAADSSRLQHHDSAMISADDVTTFESEACRETAPSAAAAMDAEQSRKSLADGETPQRPQEETMCSSCFLASSVMPSRRASYPTQQTGAYSSLLSPSSLLRASPRRNTCGRVSMTPDDFALPRVVGYPPLHFPHGQGAMLVHCALPSPYDPDLPTPPIVLTPHTSYDDLNVDFSDKVLIAGGAEQPGFNNNNNNRTFSRGGSWEVAEGEGGEARNGGAWGPDISRSRSFPNLHRKGRFQEPHQTWPVLGEAGHQGSNGMDAVDPDKALTGPRRNSWGGEEDRFVGDGVSSTASGSPPGSPSNSRAAVIGRLRSVVERRLSATGPSSQAALDDG